MDITLVVDQQSPLLTGRADQVVDQWMVGVVDSFGAQGLSQLHLLMDRAFRNPTPYYETQVTADRAAADLVIHDRGIVYGSWLEGVGSRNRTTRFKGYWHWRRTKQWLAETEGPRIVERHMPRLLEGLV